MITAQGAERELKNTQSICISHTQPSRYYTFSGDIQSHLFQRGGYLNYVLVPSRTKTFVDLK